jgi:hypothetical protein
MSSCHGLGWYSFAAIGTSHKVPGKLVPRTICVEGKQCIIGINWTYNKRD